MLNKQVRVSQYSLILWLAASRTTDLRFAQGSAVLRLEPESSVDALGTAFQIACSIKLPATFVIAVSGPWLTSTSYQHLSRARPCVSLLNKGSCTMPQQGALSPKRLSLPTRNHIIAESLASPLLCRMQLYEDRQVHDGVVKCDGAGTAWVTLRSMRTPMHSMAAVAHQG